MKFPLLLCSLVLSVPAWCANEKPFEASSNTGTFQAEAMSNERPPYHLKKPLRERKLFDKGRGTTGLILGIVLGPVGYAGVHIFSHNIAIREKAKTGFAILVWSGNRWLADLAGDSQQSEFRRCALLHTSSNP